MRKEEGRPPPQAVAHRGFRVSARWLAVYTEGPYWALLGCNGNLSAASPQCAAPRGKSGPSGHRWENFLLLTFFKSILNSTSALSKKII